MKKALLMPVIAAALMASACDEDDDPIVTNQARVRFVNAIPGLSANVGFTANNTFVSGSGTAFGQASATCASVNSGTAVPLAFGTVNTAGTALSGNALATNNQNSLTAGGNFTVIAAGTQTQPSLIFLNNNFSGTIGTNQAAIRFVNLVPTSTSANFDLFTGTSTTPTAENITFGNASAFTTVASGSTNFSFRNAAGTNVTLTGSNSVNLATGTINTIAIIPTSGGGFQMLNITAC